MLRQGHTLKQTFMRFMIPSVAAQWVFALYGMVDGLFVARGVSEAALSAVNISIPFLMFLFTASITISTGSSTIIAILLGQGKRVRANGVYTQTLIVTIIVSAIITVLTLLCLEPLARFLGATDSLIGYVKEYIGTLAWFSIFFIVVYTFEVLVKTDGRPRLAIIFMMSGTVLNCVLDYLMIIAFGWGVFGAAFATGLSQAFVVMLYLFYFLGPRANLRLCRFRFNWRTFGRMLALGLPSGVTELSAGATIFLFNNAIIAHINEEAVVSYTIAAYAHTIVVMSMVGVTQGMQPLVSYYHGRKDRAACEKLLQCGLISAAVLTIVMFAVCMYFADAIVGAFISRELAGLRAYSAAVFRTFGLSFLLIGANIVTGGYLTAIEREKSSLCVSIGRGFAFTALSLAILTRTFGGSGIWWAATLSEGMCLVLTAALFVWSNRFALRTQAAADAKGESEAAARGGVLR